MSIEDKRSCRNQLLLESIRSWSVQDYLNQYRLFIIFSDETLKLIKPIRSSRWTFSLNVGNRGWSGMRLRPISCIVQQKQLNQEWWTKLFEFLLNQLTSLFVIGITDCAAADLAGGLKLFISSKVSSAVVRRDRCWLRELRLVVGYLSTVVFLATRRRATGVSFSSFYYQKKHEQSDNFFEAQLMNFD